MADDDVTDDELEEINRKRRAARLRELTREEARQQLRRRTRGDDDFDAATFLAAIPHDADTYVPPFFTTPPDAPPAPDPSPIVTVDVTPSVIPDGSSF